MKADNPFANVEPQGLTSMLSEQQFANLVAYRYMIQNTAFADSDHAARELSVNPDGTWCRSGSDQCSEAMILRRFMKHVTDQNQPS